MLIYVVWAIMLLSLFAASIGSRTLFAIGLTERLSEALRADSLARGALQYALVTLQADPSPTVDGLFEVWSDNPGVFQAHALMGGSFQIKAPERVGGEIRYGLTDEERRLNLSTAPAEALQRLFQLVGAMQEDDAARLAAAVEDWRDEDDRERPLGAEGIYYRSHDEGYDCKDGPFETLEEFRLVRDVTPALYQALEPHLTVYGSGLVNLNSAGDSVLQALGLSGEGVAGFRSYRSGEDGIDGTVDDRRLVSTAQLESELKDYVPVEDLAQLSELATAQAIGVTSTAFRMLIDADTGHRSGRMQALCVMDRDGAIKLWSEHSHTTETQKLEFGAW